METENYVYKKEIDWFTLMEGFTLPLDNQVIFLRNMENFLQRGESKIIHFFMNGKTYDAKIVNVNNSAEKRKKDAYQIRYTRNGELAQTLQQYFFKSMSYIKTIRESRDPKDKSYIKVPEGLKEYLAIYTTEYEDTFLLEPIGQEDFQVMKKTIQGMRESFPAVSTMQLHVCAKRHVRSQNQLTKPVPLTLLHPINRMWPRWL